MIDLQQDAYKLYKFIHTIFDDLLELHALLFLATQYTYVYAHPHIILLLHPLEHYDYATFGTEVPRHSIEWWYGCVSHYKFMIKHF